MWGHTQVTLGLHHCLNHVRYYIRVDLFNEMDTIIINVEVRTCYEIDFLI